MGIVEGVMSQTLNAVLVDTVEVSPGLFIMRVVPDGWELGDFIPGQFAVLGLPASARRCAISDTEEETLDADRLIKRAYSIASSSVYKEFLEFYVALVPSGSLTPRLFALEPGDRLWLGKKVSGMFTLEQAPEDKHLVLIATGTGLAPYMSMMRSQLTCGGARRFSVLHGARHSWDLGYRSELMTLNRMCSNFTYVPSISRPDEEPAAWGGLTGHIQQIWKQAPLEELFGHHPGPDETDIFVCGNPDMIESMLEILKEEGFEEHSKSKPGQIHVEKYW